MTATTSAGRAVRILSPGDDGWDAARVSFNVLADQRPAAIALPENAGEVAEAVGFARAHGLLVAAQGTGHGAGARESLEGTLLINTSRLTEVHIDAAERRVRVGAGARWRDVTPQLSELGLAALHGSSPEVGIVGYSLGGGIGWLARAHGLQSTAVQAIELVTADGALIHADAQHHAELFWALRGGGGSFGVVTAVEFGAVEAREVYAGALFFPVERVAEVLSTWTASLPSYPDELTTWAVVLHFPPFEEVPEQFRGRSFAIVLAAFLGDEEAGRALLQPLEALGPVLDTRATQPPLGLAALAMDPESPVPFRSGSALLSGLTPETIDSIAALATSGPALTLIQLRHLGGALNRAPADPGALATVPGGIALFSLGIAPDAAAAGEVERRLALLTGAVAGEKLGDYANLVEQPIDASVFFDASGWERLVRVKAAYDPDDLIRGNHRVPVAR